MVWSLRLICYFSNVLFWDSTKGSLEAVISIPFVSDAILWAYSILSFEFLELTVRRKFNPKYADLNLSEEAYNYRVGRERILITSWLFCGVNFIGSAVASLAIHGALSNLAFLGLFGLLFASLFTMFGCAFLVARGVETGELNLLLILFGFGFLIPPAVYLVFMVYYAFLM